MFDFNWLDIAILSIIVISGLISLMRGFIKEALSLIAWLLAFWVAIKFSKELAFYFAQWITSPEARLGISFALLFVATLLLCAFINLLLVSILQKTGLSGTDRLLGMLFGFARGVLLITLALLLLRLTPLPQEPWWQQSYLVPYFLPLEQWLHDLLPSINFEQTAALEPQASGVQQLEPIPEGEGYINEAENHV